MPLMTDITQKARWPGDPRIVETGPSSRSASDSAAKMLGWFSIGLGLAELFAAERMTKANALIQPEKPLQKPTMRPSIAPTASAVANESVSEYLPACSRR